MDAQAYAQSVDDAINRTAAIAGMDPAHWRAIASIESGVNPSSNRNADTQFKGLFQLGHGVWHDHGGGDIYDPYDNALAAAKYAAANAQQFQNRFGRAPTPGETYLMHQQGSGFYLNNDMTNISGNLPRWAKNDPNNYTPGGFENFWSNELERRAGGQMPVAPQSVLGQGGASGGSAAAGSLPPGAVASQQGTAASPTGSTDTATSATPDIGAQIQGLQDKFAQQDQESQQPSMQWMNIPQAISGMQRARQLSAIMQAKSAIEGMTAPLPTGGKLDLTGGSPPT